MDINIINDMNFQDLVLCGICGEPHSYSECSIIQIRKEISDTVIPSKARLTLPEGVAIQTMADGTYCVVATNCIEKGTQFGPLEAQKLLTLHPSVAFPMKIFNQDIEDLTEYYLDTCNENSCNWMMFVTPAQNSDEQNLICFQEKSKIYYVTVKEVPAGEFLRVWYSPYYAKRMNKNVLMPQNATEFFDITSNVVEPIDLNKLLKKQQKIMERDIWTCKFCGKLENDVTLFATHILEHYSKRLTRQCDICKESFSNLRNLRRHMKLAHAADENTKKCKMKEVPPDKLKTKDAIVGGPLLNDLLNDSVDNTNLVLPSIELNQLGLTLSSSMENQNMLLETDSLSLNVDNLLTENVKELDHFNFEIGESQEQYVCDVCLKVFSKLAYLVQHLKKHTGKYTCPHCLKIFCRGENLNAHKCTDKIPQHTCDLCQRSFMLRKYLVRHMNAIHNKKYTCENCNKQYHSHKEYKEHNCSAVPDIHKQTFACVTCSKKFFREIYLKKHLLRTHIHRDRKNILPKHFICEVCAHRFSDRRGLQLHMKMHMERTHVCPVCDKKFYRQNLLDNHMAIHEEAKVACPICNAKLKTKQSLAIHMRQHTGLKPYKCDMCSMSFRQNSNLVIHCRRVHSETCYVCNKRFPTAELLKAHQAEHTFKEIFICPLCKKVIKLKSSLRRHLKQIHPKEDLNTIMLEIKPQQVNFAEDTSKSNSNLINNNPEVDDINIGISSELIDCEINSNLDANTVNENFDNLVKNFENIIGGYDSNDADNLGLNSYANTSENSAEKRTLDFNDLEIDLDSNFDVQPNLNLNNQEVCLSMPDLSELDQEITFGDNAYILENGTIVEPKDQGNVLVYILDKNF